MDWARSATRFTIINDPLVPRWIRHRPRLGIPPSSRMSLLSRSPRGDIMRFHTATAELAYDDYLRGGLDAAPPLSSRVLAYYLDCYPDRLPHHSWTKRVIARLLNPFAARASDACSRALAPPGPGTDPAYDVLGAGAIHAAQLHRDHLADARRVEHLACCLRRARPRELRLFLAAMLRCFLEQSDICDWDGTMRTLLARIDDYAAGRLTEAELIPPFVLPAELLERLDSGSPGTEEYSEFAAIAYDVFPLHRCPT